MKAPRTGYGTPVTRGRSRPATQVRLDPGTSRATRRTVISMGHTGTTHGVRVEVRGLSKSFGSVRAVSDLGFTVEPGSITGFLGPNGAGKTTTLRMLLG